LLEIHSYRLLFQRLTSSIVPCWRLMPIYKLWRL